MSMIINKKIPMFIKGYPTVSDKYNVAGGTLTGSKPVKFGELVVKSTQTSEGCYFEAVGTTISNVANIAGFVIATNVKLATDWPGTTVEVKPNEAFNLSLPGTYMAIELDHDIVTSQLLSNITAGKQVAVYLTGAKVGQLTYTGASSSSVTATDLPDVVFTGLYEEIDGKLLAEIYIK